MLWRGGKRGSSTHIVASIISGSVVIPPERESRATILLLIVERLMFVMDESRLEMLAQQHGIRRKRDDGGIKKTLTAFIRRADEGTLSRLLVEASVLLATSRSNGTTILKTLPPPTRWTLRPSRPRYGRSSQQKRRPRRQRSPQRKPQRKQPNHPFTEGRRFAVPHFYFRKNRQREPAWVSPCTLIPLPAPLAGLARQKSSSSSCTFPWNPASAFIQTDRSSLAPTQSRGYRRKNCLQYMRVIGNA